MDRLGPDILSVLRMKGQVDNVILVVYSNAAKKCDNYRTKLAFEEIHRYEIGIKIVQMETGKKGQSRISIFRKNCKKRKNNKLPEVKKHLNQKTYKQTTRRSSF